MATTITIFKRFERLWHWLQALLILLLLATGLELHGLFSLFGFNTAVQLHDWAGFIWLALLVLVFSWIATTGEWRQYKPSFDGVPATLKYYAYGVFKGQPHPHHMTVANKFNPLQRLGYIAILFVMLPVQIFTGLMFFFFPELRAAGWLQQIDWIAIIHTLNAYALLSFLVIHLYMITFGATLGAHLKAMVTGKEQIDSK
ncbi:cytochrome b/b6 domain-containing protein [Neiella sp. HB171785]|uniref:Cytochrome b/b6 domain-containing protein n=1 Tax=Neiella litorisoli TaxID=2771431 RepID=A0A8J6QRL9_9GAMM|nr:cytochrome b/b6 domain-containing protein [Neiella litorisoli]MBD1390306.1 cytochrome b/b6 domain-containing protein [Neiella litorisoli]